MPALYKMSVQLTLNLDECLAEELKVFAWCDGRTMAGYIRRVLDEHVQS